MIIREVETSDAKKLAKVFQRVDEESDYMLWEPGERIISTENQKKMITDFNHTDNSTILVAEKDHKLTGYLLARGGNARRNKHSAYIVVGIVKDYRGKGVGTLLFDKLEQWAHLNQISRLELTVAAENTAGIALYKKRGFQIEGTKRNALWIKGECVDEYYMAKIL